MFQSTDLFDFNQGPLENFHRLFEEYKKNVVNMDPTVMTLATVDDQGLPNARIVLLKQIEQESFIFYTNYQSAKAKELESHPYASLVFFWESFGAQIRVKGSVEKTSRSQSESYFKTRPRLSQLGAWASQQSSVISSHEALQDRLNLLTQQFEGKEIPCPEYWGGYRISSEVVEFWFSREGHLHHRYIYERSGKTWKRYLKAP